MDEIKIERKISDLELIKNCLKNNPDRLEELASISDRLGLLIAENEETPSELLHKLGNNKNKNIRKAVVSNPNTPKETLFELGEYFSKELLDNPVFDLLYLENCNFVKDIPFLSFPQ